MVALLVTSTVADATGSEVQPWTDGFLETNYPAGWSMVGVPPGTSLTQPATSFMPGSGFTALSTYRSNRYVRAQGAHPKPCRGYWGYASIGALAHLSPHDGIREAGGKPVPLVRMCTVQRGWNLVGNPFPTAALLPPSTYGYAWNPSLRDYYVTHHILGGQAAWVYAGRPKTVTLRATSGLGASANITTFTPSAPIHLHVGDAVRFTYFNLPEAGMTLTTNETRLPLQETVKGGVRETRLWLAAKPGRTAIRIETGFGPAPQIHRVPVEISRTGRFEAHGRVAPPPPRPPPPPNLCEDRVLGGSS